MGENELPKGWVGCILGDISIIQSGGTPSRQNSKYWNGNIPWIKISDIKELYVNEATEFITEEGLKNSSTRIFPKGTILFTIFATIGRIGILNIEATTNQAIAGITPSPLLNHKYLTYSLIELSNSISDYGKGVAQKNINQAILKNTIIPLPPLAEQNRIVEKLDKLFASIKIVKAKLDTVPQLLKNFRNAVLNQAVTGKLTETWREGRDLEEWRETKIGNMFEVKTGSTPLRANSRFYENGNIPWLKSGQVNNSLIYQAEEFITETAIRETNAKVFPIDTLLVAMYGEGKTRGQVGWMKIKAATNQAIAALINEEMDLVTKNYVYLFCLSQYNEIRAEAEGGNQPNLNLSKIKNWELKIPTLEEQQEIVSRVKSLFAKANAIEKQYQTLKAKLVNLPQAILARAFKGELVAQNSNDESAGLLLKRIKETQNLSQKIKKLTQVVV